MNEERYDSAIKYIPPSITKVDDSHVRLFMGPLYAPLKLWRLTRPGN